MLQSVPRETHIYIIYMGINYAWLERLWTDRQADDLFTVSTRRPSTATTTKDFHKLHTCWYCGYIFCQQSHLRFRTCLMLDVISKETLAANIVNEWVCHYWNNRDTRMSLLPLWYPIVPLWCHILSNLTEMHLVANRCMVSLPQFHYFERIAFMFIDFWSLLDPRLKLSNKRTPSPQLF